MNVTIVKGNSPTLTYVALGQVEIAFSYTTPVAFNDGGRWVVSENVWSHTTGKHLSEIPGGRDKASRIPHADFTARLDALLARLDAPVGS